ncbi:MAG TPA: glutamate--cysteine ligase [Gammaproteobacteria bacterium]|nr:glutamate--cysteine ligase [Gammaproteobacteria bacterium]
MNPNSKSGTRLDRLLAQHPAALRGGRKGLEKESLRVNPRGCLAQTPHPSALGSALTHPHITTDYSEALLELVTDPFADARDTLHSLCDIHTFVYQHLTDDELLWATSMPCALEGDERIPIARYGHSNIGMMKHVYRRGLGYRYGRSMQTISGVHFNYSFPEAVWPVLQELAADDRTPREFINDAYFGMLRNFQRISWLLLYLFGASPAVCKTFLLGRDLGFQAFDAHTWYEPFATSLRMSDIGYKNKNQSQVGVSYDSLYDYVSTLTHAVTTPVPEYEAIGVKVDGEYRQLNANILQIENEFYSFIRPKQPIEPGERPTAALCKRGVNYAEVRALDVNVFDPLGVSLHALHFVEALLIGCLLDVSAPLGRDEQVAISHNQTVTARHGRDPALALQRDGKDVALRDWAFEIVARLDGICEALDGNDPARPYTTSLAIQREAIADPERTPSARMLAEMREHRESFFMFAQRLSRRHRDYFLARQLQADVAAALAQQASQSLTDQADLERRDSLDFDEYLQRYFART